MNYKAGYFKKPTFSNLFLYDFAYLANRAEMGRNGPGQLQVVHNFVVSAQAWAFGLEPGPVPAQMAIQ